MTCAPLRPPAARRHAPVARRGAAGRLARRDRRSGSKAAAFSGATARTDSCVAMAGAGRAKERTETELRHPAETPSDESMRPLPPSGRVLLSAVVAVLRAALATSMQAAAEAAPRPPPACSPPEQPAAESCTAASSTPPAPSLAAAAQPAADARVDGASTPEPAGSRSGVTTPEPGGERPASRTPEPAESRSHVVTAVVSGAKGAVGACPHHAYRGPPTHADNAARCRLCFCRRLLPWHCSRRGSARSRCAGRRSCEPCDGRGRDGSRRERN